jgi:hypothetical protein
MTAALYVLAGIGFVVVVCATMLTIGFLASVVDQPIDTEKGK